MDLSVAMQKGVRDNAQDLYSFMNDMRSWEQEMKLKEKELPVTDSPAPDKDVPPVRSKPKKAKAKANKKKVVKRISSSDYSSWEKFDADKACELVDDDNASLSQDDQASEEDKNKKLVEEAHYEKERGNSFVQLKKWDNAIECYSRAIDLYKFDATYFANRALCYLKRENLHAAEADCTAALELDPKYAKALLRRSSAREGLGSLRRAASDLNELLKLEPNNELVKRQLSNLIKRMGTKGPNSKCSPATTPSGDMPAMPFNFNDEVDFSEKDDSMQDEESFNSKDEIQEEKESSNKDNTKKCELKSWCNIPDSTIIETVEKLPHLRSKKPMTRISVTEIPAGKTVNSFINSNTNKILDQVEPSKKKVLFDESSINKNNLNAPEIKTIPQTKKDVLVEMKNKLNTEKIEEVTTANNNTNNDSIECSIVDKFSVPKSSIQFISDWRILKGKDKELSAYLSAIPPADLPVIFKSSLESEILSDILGIILLGIDFAQNNSIQSMPYLKSLSEVKRFSALAMFLSNSDKEVVSKILQRCKENENISEDEIKQIKNKYEI